MKAIKKLLLIISLFIISLNILKISFDTKNIQASNDITSYEKYDGRDYGYITKVKDQGDSNLCWAYSSISASEASILKQNIDTSTNYETLNLNPLAAAYRINNRGSDPLNNTNGENIAGDYTKQTGNPSKITTLFSQWWGPISSNDVTIDPFTNSNYRLENAFHILEYKDDANKRISEIKKAIVEYGAVTFQYNNLHDYYYYNPKSETSSSSYPHACTIIGWDDTILANKFLPKAASMNGGWLIKNSYSSNPYFYISYDNTSSYMYAFSYALKDKYDNNYFYDSKINDFPLRNDKCVANIYQSKGNENLKAINVGVDGNNYSLEVEVYKNLKDASNPTNGTLIAKEVNNFTYGGYITISLTDEVILKKDEWFSIVVRVSNGNAKIRICEKNGKDYSFTKASTSFSKLNNYVGRIKALTKNISQVDSNSTFTNLVVLTKFSDEDEFINDIYQGSSVKEIINNTYNLSNYSIHDYFSSISNGKVNIKTLFLFNNNESITLSKPRGYYALKDELNPNGYNKEDENLRAGELREDWANAINNAFLNGNKPVDIDGNEYSYSELDKNNDGSIDCITIIYKPTVQNISVSWSSPLWDYQYYNPLVSVKENNKTITSNSYVQLTLSYENQNGESTLYKSSDNLVIASTGKICHETLHVFGLLDLYKADSSSEVYFMSAMGKPLTPAIQYISIKEREALGFVSNDELLTLTKDGTYTLNVTAPYSSNVVGYKLDIPEIDKTLYLEYRRFDGSINKYDTKSKELYSCKNNELIKGQTLKSGLVCYLAKTGIKYPSNLNGSNQLVVCSHGIYNTKSDAAVKEGEYIEITDDLFIEVTSMNETTLEFTIEGIKNNTPEHTHNLQFVDKVDDTCTTNGHISYYYCPDCNKYFTDKEANNEITLDDTIIKAKHNLTFFDRVEPTCTSDGNIAYYHCSKCDKYFTDSLGANEIPKDSIKLIGSHKLTFVKGHEATCTKEGLKDYYICSACNSYFDINDKENAIDYSSLIIPINPNKHSLKFIDKVNSTCTTNGHISYYYCTTCNKYFTDKDANNEIALDDTIIKATHSLTFFDRVEPTCTSDGNIAYYHCSKCDKYFTDSLGVNEIFKDSIKLVGSHKLTFIKGYEATCTKEGLKDYYICSVCNKYFDINDKENAIDYSSLIIPIDHNKHNLQFIDKTDATCIKDGNISYYHCIDCNKYFSDKDANNEIVLDDIVIKATHNLTLFDRIEPTCTSDGNIAYYHCVNCDRYFLDSTASIEVSHMDVILHPSSHSLIFVKGYEATCIKEGLKDYYICSVCNKYFDINDKENAIDYPNLIIPINPNNHNFGEWIEEVVPTINESGVKAHKDCLYCNKHFDKDNNEITNLIIEKLPSTSIDNKGCKGIASPTLFTLFILYICLKLKEKLI